MPAHNQCSDSAVHNVVKTLPNKPGVYRMLDAKGTVIYVGKARKLKNRVSSYFQKNITDAKTRVLISHVQGIEITLTHTENEALLLENNLIKRLKPRYNIYFRDDKSYPFIYISSHQQFPRLAFHRGAKQKQGQYFGPYPNAGAVRETLSLLQKLFLVRQCEDTFFRNRTRPCLQYQIKRCTAPCVERVDKETYQRNIRHAVMFLEGKSNQVISELACQMEQAANDLDYEHAAQLRDQITHLRRVYEKQYISAEQGEFDVIASASSSGIACVQVFTIRGGRNLGNKTFYLRNVDQNEEASIIDIFIPQYYLQNNRKVVQRSIPDTILISSVSDEHKLLQEVLSEQRGKRVIIQHKVRGERLHWIKMAVTNAKQALSSYLNSQFTPLQRLEALMDALQLDEMPSRLECFDISHTMGEATVASCVVFDTAGPVKSDYRRFNIKDITPGDDYAALHQALARRYKRLKQGESRLPDILFIDGGKGQLAQAEAVLEELQISGVTLIGIAKGSTRKPGTETLYLSKGRLEEGTKPLSCGDNRIILRADSPALHLIQQIRDEAHRFAITGHRQQRQRSRRRSVLEDIPGVGPKRRQMLLRQFGGLQEVSRAGTEDLAGVTGISHQLAQRIYDAFHVTNN